MPENLKPQKLAPLEPIHLSVTQCTACPRLREYCQGVARTKRRAFMSDTYWGKPVRGFGDPNARLFIVGLAPAAHGANRTGRMFTGDRSGEWLYRALYRAGFANQPTSVSAEDGLELRDAYISSVVKCAPPGNKPTLEELKHCAGFLRREISAMPQTRVWLALGGIALQGLWPWIAPRSASGKLQTRPKFGHGASLQLDGDRWLLMSYHPSQQNTFTGRLTEPMLDSVFARARALVGIR